VIVLENEGENSSFGTNATAQYLGRELPAMGRLLPHYFAVGHQSLDNYIALVSGQPPNAATEGDCPFYADFVATGPASADGVLPGQGCVFPASVPTIANELDQANRTWRIYGEDMAASPNVAATSCRHPAINTPDGYAGASANDNYATRHIPFVYFHSVIDNTAECQRGVVDFSKFEGDLASASSTPALSFLIPNLCEDGHDDPCQNGTAGGYAGIDRFLRAWVPRIVHSPAYEADGLLIVTFDESDSQDSSACCNETAGPNTPSPGITGAGGGDTGTVLLAPCLGPGSVDTASYNHYSLLRTVEDVFGLKHLGMAAAPGLHDIRLPGCTPSFQG
jgi:hypothetical protein